ncbi:RNA methyltransferase [Hyphomicrobiales bacterium]|jgi:tRNA/rRNA methyltransferase|nr:RNA methyltransferase [Hyphomicrobiales bacterium]MDC0139273.1 RNA methyltransferase [Hyphomicrobiales bacterium]|tara:strand:- start:2304 stop:3107 length:804 start_codon:yes stop_codon:yes gene_type:complete
MNKLNLGMQNLYETDGMSDPYIVLVRPQLGENIGAVARAMANFNLFKLRIVSPRDGWPNNKAYRSAAGASVIIDNTGLFDSLELAIQDLDYVFATTARRRDMIKPITNLRNTAIKTKEMVAKGSKVGIIFGPEKSGLTNEDISLCNGLVMAPVNPDFASLNLAQAVLLIAYEWFLISSDGKLGRETQSEKPRTEGLSIDKTRLATKEEYIKLFSHLEDELGGRNFFRPLEKKKSMINNLRNMIQRQNLTEKDVKTFHGIIKALSKEK